MKGLVFTPVSLLKKAFKHGERSLSREEIVQRLYAITQDPSYDTEKCIQLALNHSHSPFREGNSRAIIEYVHETLPLATHVFRLLNEVGQPLTEEKILRKLRSQGLISWNYSFDRLGLHADSRFSQLEQNGRWCNSDWELVNDDLVTYMIYQGIEEILVRDAFYMIQNRLNLPKHYRLFVPQVDTRFLIEGDKLYLRNLTHKEDEAFILPDDNKNLADSKKTNDSMMEVAVAMSQEMVQEQGKKTVVEEVIQDLFAALIKLEKRSDEMKQEVLQFFSINNLGAIQDLIQEKDKNEKVLIKLQELIDEIS